jgi:hypothetical protein
MVFCNITAPVIAEARDGKAALATTAPRRDGFGALGCQSRWAV